MDTLRLDFFLSAGNDLETAQYRLLAGLQSVRTAFQDNIIYPYLGRLIQLHNALVSLIERAEDVRESLPGQVKELDLENRRVIYEKQHLDDDQFHHLEELIRWAIPHIQATIEEGRTIFEFVEDHLTLQEVGIVPSYVKEGYLLLPDRGERVLHVLIYEMSIFAGVDERFRSLKTTHFKCIAIGTVEPTPATIKLDLVTENRELPNPATFHFVTELDFPFSETLLPVAKRKLMRHLYSQGLAA